MDPENKCVVQSYQNIANKAPVEAAVTQNAKVFESGDNFHLQPTAIWNKANTKNRN